MSTLTARGMLIICQSTASAVVSCVSGRSSDQRLPTDFLKESPDELLLCPRDSLLSAPLGAERLGKEKLRGLAASCDGLSSIEETLDAELMLLAGLFTQP